TGLQISSWVLGITCDNHSTHAHSAWAVVAIARSRQTVTSGLSQTWRRMGDPPAASLAQEERAAIDVVDDVLHGGEATRAPRRSRRVDVARTSPRRAPEPAQQEPERRGLRNADRKRPRSTAIRIISSWPSTPAHRSGSFTTRGSSSPYGAGASDRACTPSSWQPTIP